MDKRTDPAASKGWTAVIMERSSRFIIEQQCGPKNAFLFESVMLTVCEHISQTEDITFFFLTGSAVTATPFFLFAQKHYATANRDVRQRCSHLVLKSALKIKGGGQQHKRGSKRKIDSGKSQAVNL